MSEFTDFVDGIVDEGKTLAKGELKKLIADAKKDESDFVRLQAENLERWTVMLAEVRWHDVDDHGQRRPAAHLRCVELQDVIRAFGVRQQWQFFRARSEIECGDVTYHLGRNELLSHPLGREISHGLDDSGPASPRHEARGRNAMTGSAVLTHHFDNGFYGWRIAVRRVRRRVPAACHYGE